MKIPDQLPQQYYLLKAPVILSLLEVIEADTSLTTSLPEKTN